MVACHLAAHVRKPALIASYAFTATVVLTTLYQRRLEARQVCELWLMSAAAVQIPVSISIAYGSRPAGAQILFCLCKDVHTNHDQLADCLNGSIVQCGETVTWILGLKMPIIKQVRFAVRGTLQCIQVARAGVKVLLCLVCVVVNVLVLLPLCNPAITCSRFAIEVEHSLLRLDPGFRSIQSMARPSR
ncbi:hypothetical protein BCR37DRAFT_375846 [Protomyces lactucae-debilis]|uniref:Uncharacterized protein n=1 Tax=Protomyces lactucae-debilis TaxID=2754530 RepID=A0A1Y2FV50_PROLT|nr:uncharacterized protein BCR37DRAFT_375846 [Protomyces lactucae-debilis]ORY87893.1 hypothetical protein BCR37DRAFT_375846 [Protomyces lactucae-debilis]